MKHKNKRSVPRRLAHGGNLEKGSAPTGVLQARRGVKYATGARVGSRASEPPEMSYGTGEEGVKLRIGTINVGTMTVQSGEVVEVVERRLFYFCLQEV